MSSPAFGSHPAFRVVDFDPESGIPPASGFEIPCREGQATPSAEDIAWIRKSRLLCGTEVPIIVIVKSAAASVDWEEIAAAESVTVLEQPQNIDPAGFRDELATYYTKAASSYTKDTNIPERPPRSEKAIRFYSKADNPASREEIEELLGTTWPEDQASAAVVGNDPILTRVGRAIGKTFGDFQRNLS